LHFLRHLLWPFAFVYGAIVSLRNYGYDIGILKSYRPPIPLVCVGNLSVGGTGKSPMVGYLVSFFATTHKVVILSRGYGRKTRGYLRAGASSTASQIGDEPFMLYERFNGHVPVIVCENRKTGIERILKELPATTLILMDDGYQHRAVTPWLSILLTEYEFPFTRDFILPVGNLRESRGGANRSTVRVITKCPSNANQSLFDELKPRFFTSIGYQRLSPVTDSAKAFVFNKYSKCVLITGIANSTPLVEYLTELHPNFKVVKIHSLPDHHPYTFAELTNLLTFAEYNNMASEGESVFYLTTEKDIVKWKEPHLVSAIMNKPVFYIPISVQFLGGEDRFQALCLHTLACN
jgi:tetraacyldisaccharide 4'-kinase